MTERRTITIDRIILIGVPVTPAEARRLRSALEAELARALAAGPLPEAREAERLNAGTVRLDGRETPLRAAGKVARQVARAVKGRE